MDNHYRHHLFEFLLVLFPQTSNGTGSSPGTMAAFCWMVIPLHHPQKPAQSWVRIDFDCWFEGAVGSTGHSAVEDGGDFPLAFMVRGYRSCFHILNELD